MNNIVIFSFTEIASAPLRIRALSMKQLVLLRKGEVLSCTEFPRQEKKKSTLQLYTKLDIKFTRFHFYALILTLSPRKYHLFDENKQKLSTIRQKFYLSEI